MADEHDRPYGPGEHRPQAHDAGAEGALPEALISDLRAAFHDPPVPDVRWREIDAEISAAAREVLGQRGRVEHLARPHTPAAPGRTRDQAWWWRWRPAASIAAAAASICIIWLLAVRDGGDRRDTPGSRTAYDLSATRRFEREHALATTAARARADIDRNGDVDIRDALALAHALERGGAERADAERADAEGAGTEGTDTEGTDTEGPDAAGPDAERADAAGADWDVDQNGRFDDEDVRLVALAAVSLQGGNHP